MLYRLPAITIILLAALLTALMPSPSSLARVSFSMIASGARFAETDSETNPGTTALGSSPQPDALPIDVATGGASGLVVAPTEAVQAQVTVFLPLIARPLPLLPDDWLGRVNGYRARAGVPPVTADATLNDNCFQHARYMAENNDLTHNQNPSLPYASPAGQICAQKGNVWMGWGSAWQPRDAIDGWMGSVGHRLWLLYPTTPTFGFGFYRQSQRSAAALDVLSRARFGDDARYPGWPVRYPAPDQQDVPATRYPITLQWPYFDQKPVVTGTSLRALPGTDLEHTATTDLPVNHKGIVITPNQAFPPNATIEVTVTGSYKGQAFSFTWQFRTGD
ncbi:MAG: CAP domain-containing protein [Roseiflexus sp.]|nr:CAP domain-containing protein [Roseiflexus sp.]MDW8147938.1 CAP domain-containing protein [Roseiflexaceae bacterium]MDW8233790.1 CAP domain-containing protein [Roseiflexaceae bacterium]